MDLLLLVVVLKAAVYIRGLLEVVPIDLANDDAVPKPLQVPFDLRRNIHRRRIKRRPFLLLKLKQKHIKDIPLESVDNNVLIVILNASQVALILFTKDDPVQRRVQGILFF